MLVATCLVVHSDGVTLSVHAKTFFAAESAFHGRIKQPRGQGSVCLVTHVFFATKSTTVGYQFNSDIFVCDVQDTGNVVAVVPDALTT